jgi:hypothetical protein
MYEGDIRLVIAAKEEENVNAGDSETKSMYNYAKEDEELEG